jgi:hypothetical protein
MKEHLSAIRATCPAHHDLPDFDALKRKEHPQYLKGGLISWYKISYSAGQEIIHVTQNSSTSSQKSIIRSYSEPAGYSPRTHMKFF